MEDANYFMFGGTWVRFGASVLSPPGLLHPADYAGPKKMLVYTLVQVKYAIA
jgi:hypothetical protein